MGVSRARHEDAEGRVAAEQIVVARVPVCAWLQSPLRAATITQVQNKLARHFPRVVTFPYSHIGMAGRTKLTPDMKRVNLLVDCRNLNAKDA